MNQLENRLKTLDHEEAFIFDKNGKLVSAYTGGESEVSIPAWEFLRKDATITHGHPVDKNNYGGTLSPADVMNIADSSIGQMRAVAQGQGEYKYIVRRTSKADGKGLKSKINRDLGWLEKTAKEEAKNTKRRVYKKTGSKASASHAAEQAYKGVYDWYWKDTLPQFGFDYVKRKK